MTLRHSVLGIGNAIVDVVARTDEAFLLTHGLVKGSMNLIEASQADALYADMGSAVEISGGSAANTVAGIASFGGRAAYIGKVATDLLGRVFAHDLKAIGVTFTSAPLPGDDPPTARSLILVTPDAQRTMNTHLGACVELGPDDIDEALVTSADVTYMEGYLWDKPTAKGAYLKAARIAHEAGRKVSLTLSDSFCVDRHRDSFRDLVFNHVDILFANEAEIRALFETSSLDAAMDAVRGRCDVVVVTRSERGSVVLTREETHVVRAEPVDRLVDTTGAGDLYAAGFLHGLTTGRPLPECGVLGSLAAAEIISHYGARPEADLKALAEQRIGAPV